MKTTNWLHFIGKGYYDDIDAFIHESKQIGISRAIAYNVFKKMELGDRVFLAQKHADKKSKIFGYFIFSSILGMKAEKIDELRQKGIIKDEPVLPFAINRGCGMYVVASTSTIENRQAFMDEVKQMGKEDFDRLMIGGQFYDLSYCDIPEHYVITKIPFQQGFRMFNFEQFKADYDAARGRQVKGQYYENERQGISLVDNMKLIQIENYKLN